MAPKKQSGFMTFVHKFCEKPEGRQMSMAQAVHHCGEIWKTMTNQERGPYISGAKNANIRSHANQEKLDCHGRMITALERKEQNLANDVVQMKRDIELIVRKAKSAHDLDNVKFVFVSFNYFVKGIYNDIHIPAEFSACEFSLKGGVNSLYTSLINPGQLIFGQACDAMLHSNSTHLLPLPPSAMGEPNMAKLYQGIHDYLRSRLDQDIGDLQALKVFTTTEEIPVVKSCFRFIETGYKDDNNSDDDDHYFGNNAAAAQRDKNLLPIVVYDIQYLFYIMKKEILSVAGLPIENFNIFITDSFFSRDFYEYQDGISCSYHEEKDRGKYCTQSRVNRWAYTFCDYMCGDLAIVMQPGKHMPSSFKSSSSISQIKSNITDDESYFSLPTAESNSTINPEDEEKPTEVYTISSSSDSLTSIHPHPMSKTKKGQTKSANPDKESVERLANRNVWNLRGVIRTIDEFTDDEFSISSINHSRRHVSSNCQKDTMSDT